VYNSHWLQQNLSPELYTQLPLICPPIWLHWVNDTGSSISMESQSGVTRAIDRSTSGWTEQKCFPYYQLAICFTEQLRRRTARYKTHSNIIPTGTSTQWVCDVASIRSCTYKHGHHGISWWLSPCANSVYQTLILPLFRAWERGYAHGCSFARLRHVHINQVMKYALVTTLWKMLQLLAHFI